MSELTLLESQERFRFAKTDRFNFDTYWEKVAQLCLPTRQFLSKSQQGEQRNIQIYNETAPNAVDSLASAQHFLLTNPGERWFDLRLEDVDEAADLEVERWLYDTTTRVLAYLASPLSGFPTASHEVYQDLAAFGSSVCQIGPPRDRLLKFVARPLASTWYMADDIGNITDVFRAEEIRVRDLVAMFDSLPDDVMRMVQTATGAEEKKCLVHHVYLRSEADPRGKSAFDMPWGSRYFLEDESERSSELEVGGFRENPYQTPRWSKAAGETYGRGPAMSVLPAIQMLNAMSRDQMIGGAMLSRPPVNVWDSTLKGRKLDLSAGGVNWLTQGTRNPPVAMQHGANPSLADAMIERVEQRVERAFYLDMLELPLVRRSHSAMTAEEVVARRQQALSRASPILSRLQAEWLQPVIEKTVRWMNQSGYLIPVPDSMRGRRIKAEYTSPMAQNQSQRETNNILEALQAAALLFQADPSIMLNIDMDNALRTFWRQRNADPRVLRNRLAVAQMRQQQSQQALLPQQATAVRDLAAAGKDISETLGAVA